MTSVRPKDQVYKNGAGTMMECDLGAACVESGVYPWSSGLYYQYGRKDPFWGDHSCTYSGWNKVKSDATTGTESYAAAHPTTFIYSSNGSRHWLNSGETSLWWRSKSISDPCPPGYVVPDGGQYGVWAKAAGTTEDVRNIKCDYVYVVDNGPGALREFVSSGQCYYRPKGYIHGETGNLQSKEITSNISQYWSGTTRTDGIAFTYALTIMRNSDGSSTGYVYVYDAKVMATTDYLSSGHFVRCMKKQ